MSTLTLPTRTGRAALLLTLALALLLGAARVAWAHDGAPTDDELIDLVAFDQNLNAQMPMDATLVDEQGREMQLDGLLQGKPAVLVFAYYNCPNLCPLVLHGLIESLRPLKFDVGREFDVIVVSIDPRETPEQATAVKASNMARYGRYGTESGWHFLTAAEGEIQRLADIAGFHYAYDPKSDQYAHPTGILLLTPQGRISRYFYGLEYSPRDLRLGLIEASANQIGTPVDQVLLRCFRYDPSRGKYTMVIMNVLRLAGVFTVVLLGGLIVVMFRFKPGGQDSNPT